MRMLYLKASGLPPCLQSLEELPTKSCFPCHPQRTRRTWMLKTLKDALSAHFSPKPHIIAERYRFHQRDQLPGESLATYDAELLRFARHCNFGTNLDDCLS